MGLHDEKQKFKPQHRKIRACCICACVRVCVFPLQQAFNATAVVRHMRRLQLGTSHEGPNPNLPAHLLMPEEDAGTCSASH